MIAGQKDFFVSYTQADHKWAVISTGIAIIEAIVLIVVLVLFRPTASTNPASQSSPKPSAPPTTEGNTPITQGQSTPATATPTPTVVVGTVLCQYDTTHSFSDWNNSPQWKQVNNGIFGSDGTDRDQGPVILLLGLVASCQHLISQWKRKSSTCVVPKPNLV